MTEAGTPAVILDSRSHVVHSAVVNDDYQLSVWLPPSYATSQTRYPVVYGLDGPVTFGLAAHGSLILIFGGLLPEVVVVSVGAPLASAYDWGVTRGRDYATVPLPYDHAAGHAEAFAECLRTELVPFVDRTYRTVTTDRTLWGHSLGGAFALHLLLERPGTFHRYIATSPAVVDAGQRLLDPSRWPLAGASLPARVFVSVGSDDPDYRPAIEEFQADLAARAYRDLVVTSAVLPGLGHIAAAVSGFVTGLPAVFAPHTKAQPVGPDGSGEAP